MPHAEIVPSLRSRLQQVILGKEEVIELLLVGVLSSGHVLLEDVPGVGKTTLAKALATVLGLEFSRVQFTPDLLPGDIVGSQVLNPQDGSFRFLKGPVFTEVLLADEINRASPRTQSALLEAMSEGQVTVEGTTYPLDRPFFVLATQNPVDFQGTYPLPEAQLDRFLLRLSLGYPPHARELDMLFAHQHTSPLQGLEAATDRAGPRTQSALLEAMSEGQVTVEGTTYPLDRPFFVLATQNPVDFQGTYPLPEAQLDRFLLRLSLGYPPHARELDMLFAHQHTSPLQGLEAATDRAGLLALQAAVREVRVSREVGDYLVRLAEGTRSHPKVDLGLSPRGSLACFRAAQAQAFLQGRDYVSPDDLQHLAVPTMAHRLILAPEARYGGTSAADIVDEVVARTEVPG